MGSVGRHFSLSVVATLLIACGALAAQVVTEPFLGVRHIVQTETAPRPLKINVVEIDLSAPGLDFRVSPRSPSYPGPFINGSPAETIRQTTRSFANSIGAQIAINGAFYASSGSWANNIGLMASNGDKYSPWELPPNSDNNFDDALNVTADNEAAIVKMPAGIPTGFETNPVVPLHNTISGSHRIVQNGSAVTISGGAGNPLGAEPRTAVGLTADNAKLLLMTVDGRQFGVSQGVTLAELANLMISHGAVNAINLDGGGSTTMVMDFYGDDLAAQLVNVPSDGGERAVGNSLAVFALPNGDFNQDGVVDAADYVVWRRDIGGTLAYNAWRTNLGVSAGGGSAVPEPGALAALLVATLGTSFWRARFQRRCVHPGALAPTDGFMASGQEKC